MKLRRIPAQSSPRDAGGFYGGIGDDDNSLAQEWRGGPEVSPSILIRRIRQAAEFGPPMRLSRLRARSLAALHAFGGPAKILDRLLEVKLHPGKDEVHAVVEPKLPHWNARKRGDLTCEVLAILREEKNLGFGELQAEPCPRRLRNQGVRIFCFVATGAAAVQGLSGWSQLQWGTEGLR
eukprot:s3414_g3.t1